jgi:predicted site-specific integrase-resolvase
MTTALQEAPGMADGEGERITREDAARRLGVSLATIDRYLRTSLLSRYKNRVTGRVTLSAAEVEQLHREREQ